MAHATGTTALARAPLAADGAVAVRHESTTVVPLERLRSDPLETIGLFGLPTIATPILASLVTGDPLLLVGAHGTAKTALAEALADALGMRFRAYDASKALFEDIIGFPNPRDLGEGKLGYVPTEISIWGVEFVLVDELSRAAPAMQNKWLEVVRSRRVMGQAVESLKMVFGAMNPPGYLGARTLDAALVGRFAYIVTMPTVKDMTARQVDAVIRTVTAADAPGCKEVWTRGADSADAGSGIQQIVRESRAALPDVLEENGQPLVDYVRSFQALLRAQKIDLDGRRLSLMYRALAAGMAVDRVRGKEVADEEALFDCVRHLLPGPALDEAVPSTVLYPVHLAAWEQSFTGEVGAQGNQSQAACSVFTQTSLDRMVEQYERAVEDLSEEDHHEVVSRVVRPLGEEAGVSARRWGESVPALRRLVGVAARHHAHMPLDVVSRIFDSWRAVSGLYSSDWDEVADLAEEVDKDPRAFSGDMDWLASRAAIELARARVGDSDDRADLDVAAKRRAEVSEGLAGKQGRPS